MKKNLGLRKLLTLVLLVFMVLTVAVIPVLAEEEKPTGDFTTAVLSQYIWRGYELSRNSIVIQPSMTAAYQGFSVNLWGNLDTKPYSSTDASYTGTWNETDLTLSYGKTLGLFNIGGGYVYYGLASPNKDAADPNDSQEIFATVSLNTLLSPTLTVYKEIDHYRNWYFLLGISHIIGLNDTVSLKLAASAGYLLSTDAETYAKYDSASLVTTDKFSGFHDGSLSASLPIKLSNYITLTPTLSYIFPLTGAAKDEMKGKGIKGTTLPSERNGSYLVGGILASFSF
jgi:hypothetical protein